MNFYWIRPETQAALDEIVTEYLGGSHKKSYRDLTERIEERLGCSYKSALDYRQYVTYQVSKKVVAVCVGFDSGV